MTARPGDRSWVLVLTLGGPLAVVGVSAMAISYATLIDVARDNGMPLPELFPVLVDVGTVACLVASAHFRRRGVNGCWLAHATFGALSAISVFANATHAMGAADLTLTSAPVAILLAATPPAALLAITHLVMKLVPEGDRTANNWSADARPLGLTIEPDPPSAARDLNDPPSPAVFPPIQPEEDPVGTSVRERHVLESVDTKIREALARGGTPTGREIGVWLGGKSARTGQRHLARFLERELDAAARRTFVTHSGVNAGVYKTPAPLQGSEHHE